MSPRETRAEAPCLFAPTCVTSSTPGRVSSLVDVEDGPDAVVNVDLESLGSPILSAGNKGFAAIEPYALCALMGYRMLDCPYAGDRASVVHLFPDVSASLAERPRRVGRHALQSKRPTLWVPTTGRLNAVEKTSRRFRMGPLFLDIASVGRKS